jgi:tol-pal system protein YbgF
MDYRKILLMTSLVLLPACVGGGGNQLLNMQAQLDRDTRMVQELSRQVELLSQTMERNRGPQANMANELNSLRQTMADLNGRLDESQQNLVKAVETAATDAQVIALERRLAYVERYLGIATSSSSPVTTSSSAGSPAISTPPAPDPNAGPQQMYDAGVRLYDQKSYQAARDRFEEMLKLYPSHKLVEPAQFMLGETLYADGKYEEAILSYNQLIKNFPTGKNFTAALLKQGMSFAELGDNRSAKIVYNKIIKEHPNSAEAKTAKELLSKLP